LQVFLNFASAIGDTFTILTSSGGISGTFNGLPDGAVFMLGSSRFQISYTGTSVVLTHIADPADHFLISAPASATSGVPFDVTVTALDPGGNIDPVYTGTVTFSSSDTDPRVVLPANYTFTTADGGVHTFTNSGLGETTLISLGDQTVTATDTTGGIMGSATVTVTPGPSGPRRGEGIGFSTVVASAATQPSTAEVTKSTWPSTAEARAAPLSAVAKHDAAAKDLFFVALASDSPSPGPAAPRAQAQALEAWHVDQWFTPVGEQGPQPDVSWLHAEDMAAAWNWGADEPLRDGWLMAPAL
jgi:hypothetical protein